jgi:hypothetical protein
LLEYAAVGAFIIPPCQAFPFVPLYLPFAPHLPDEIVIPLFLSFAPILQFAQSLQIWQLLHPSNILCSPSGPIISRVFSTLCILSLLELFMLGIYCRVWSCCFSPYLHSVQWPIAHNQIRRSGPLRTTK